MKKMLLASSVVLLLVGCQTVKPADTDNTKTFYVDSSLAHCVGILQ
ncbi:hypothetical protein AB6F55_09370 [Providencia hangzhouensis]